MKLAIVTDRIYPFFKGGAEKRYWDMATNLTKRGHEFHFYTAQWPGMRKRMIIDGINIHSVYKVKNFYIDGRKSIVESLKFSIGLLVPLLNGDYDLIDCESVPILSIFPSKLASIVNRKKLIVSWLEVWDKYWFDYLGKLGLVGLLVEKISSLLPDKIISISNHTTNNLINKLKVNPEKIKTIPLGIDLQEIRGIKSGRITNKIIFVGRLIAHKNVNLLLNAVSKISKGMKIKLTIAGNGPEKSNLVRLAKRLKLKNIRFIIPKREQLIREVKSSSVLVLPSSREGFGIVVIEAMACGVPVITVNHENNAAKELILHGKNGLVCNFEEKELTESMENMLKNENYKKYETHCLKTSAKYSIENMANEIEKVYSGHVC
jgi:glycosyltransferase involved in cell wall biosynthesis